MGGRVGALLRARLIRSSRNGTPVPALVFLGMLATVVALLVRDALPVFPYLVLALSLGGGLLALAVLGDLGTLLRQDEAGDWVAALPLRPGELTLARTLHVVVSVGVLALAWFLPWAALVPRGAAGGTAMVHGAGLVAVGYLTLLTLTAGLLWLQQLLLGRLEAVFVAAETVFVSGLVVGLLQALGNLPLLAQLTPDSPLVAWLPPAWFARAVVPGGAATFLPLGIGVLAVASLPALPASSRPSRRRAGLLDRWMRPVRRIAERVWVRAEERGGFALAFVALPREREIALRTLPMLGIPLAFLAVAALGNQDHAPWRADLLSLLLVTAGIYLPLLLTHVPLTESPEAAWLLRTAPVTREALVEGTIKALFLRWLLPLYLVFLVLGLALAQGELLLRLWLPATLLGLILLRLLYPRCVRDLPLSTAPESLRADLDWAGLLTTLAVILTVLAVLANRWLGIGSGLVLSGLLGLAEAFLEGRLRPGPGKPEKRAVPPKTPSA